MELAVENALPLHWQQHKTKQPAPEQPTELKDESVVNELLSAMSFLDAKQLNI
ncbi:hypothetical protein [Pedobacter rhodius]|uniref:Uncharacterized protein n=1 Tax=Pedobacter rhodius TaxID=3004098 RepID=A0ABT4KRY7_9SPHI|nr:hypothetical protein [Pedobacter sp. SJ11]MCZ4221670.1 hypothetical protein [Pedobacter sp. SJ11]